MQQTILIPENDEKEYKGWIWRPDKNRKKYVPAHYNGKMEDLTPISELEKDLKRQVWKDEYGEIPSGYQVYLFRTDYRNVTHDNLFCCERDYWKQFRKQWEVENGYSKNYRYKVITLNYRDNTFEEDSVYDEWKQADIRRTDLNEGLKATTREAVLVRI